MLFVTASAQQVADPQFDASVERPTYSADGPTVAIDEAHGNFHTVATGYKPFADLLRNDGYTVMPGTAAFTAATLADVDVLVIANAGIRTRRPGESAFTDEASDAVRDWVRSGGALLLIADHAPAGGAAADLAARFGVEMGTGWVFEWRADGIVSGLDFTRAAGSLGEHAILAGRDPTEAVALVRAFTGQSLSVPSGATVLLRLSPSAREAAALADLDAMATAITRDASAADEAIAARSRSVGGLAQGVALRFGEGRVVVLGEAAMLSAQVVTFTDDDGRPQTLKAGMNVPGIDNRQFALNVLHWLSGVLP